MHSAERQADTRIAPHRSAVVAMALTAVLTVMATAQTPDAAPPATPAAPPPTPATTPATPEEWAKAFALLREISLDQSDMAENRVDAVLAYVRLAQVRGTPEEAVALCKRAVEMGNSREVADAAQPAAGALRRQIDGTLSGCMALLTQVAGTAGLARPAIQQAIDEHTRVITTVHAQIAAYAPQARVPLVLPAWAISTPAGVPVFAGINTALVPAPAWVVGHPTGPTALLGMALPPIALPEEVKPADAVHGPKALILTLPVHTPPDWYSKMTFPPLTGK
jgi:hypothetical protein